MNTIRLKNYGNTKMIAHRGVSGLETENTCAAFVAAGNRSYFGIETDVHRTKDGKFIIIHDDNTSRVAVDNYFVEETSYAQLRKLQLLDTDGTKGRSDLLLPDLEEYIKICKKYEKTAVLELKNQMTPDTVWEIAAAIKGLGYLENTIFISFSLENLIALREKHIKVTAQYLIGKEFILEKLIAILKENHLDLDAYYSLISEKNLKQFHNEGIKVNVWTVNNQEYAQKLVDMGIDYITSNIIE